MRRAVLFVLASVLASAAHAAPGFFPLSSGEIPQKVVDAAKRTFRLYCFQEKPLLVVRASSVPRLKALLKDKPIETLEKLGLATDELLARLLVADIDALPADTDFPLHSGGIGSAFFLAPGTLVTARHVLDRGKPPAAYFAAKTPNEARAALAEWKGRLVLMDAEGKVRFDTRRAGGIEKVLFSGHPVEVAGLPPAYDRIERSAKGQMADVVALTLKGFAAKDFLLDLAEHDPKPDDRLYAAGYPLRTERGSGDTAPDADGVSLRVSHGKAFLGAPADYSKFLKTLMEDAERERYESALVYSDADFVVGLSGGPYLNADGKVVSVASTVRHDPKTPASRKYTVTASYGPKLSLWAPRFGK